MPVTKAAPNARTWRPGAARPAPPPRWRKLLRPQRRRLPTPTAVADASHRTQPCRSLHTLLHGRWPVPPGRLCHQRGPSSRSACRARPEARTQSIARTEGCGIAGGGEQSRMTVWASTLALRHTWNAMVGRHSRSPCSRTCCFIESVLSCGWSVKTAGMRCRSRSVPWPLRFNKVVFGEAAEKHMPPGRVGEFVGGGTPVAHKLV